MKACALCILALYGLCNMKACALCILALYGLSNSLSCRQLHHRSKVKHLWYSAANRTRLQLHIPWLLSLTAPFKQNRLASCSPVLPLITQAEDLHGMALSLQSTDLSWKLHDLAATELISFIIEMTMLSVTHRSF